MEKDSVRADPARVESEFPPLRKPTGERAVQPGFRSSERITNIVTDKDGELREGEVPMDHRKVDRVTL